MPGSEADAARSAIADALGVEASGLGELTPVAGGDICRAWRLETDHGPAFAKTLAEVPAGLFAREAAGLTWLTEPGALAVPAVIGAGEAALVLSWIEPGRPGRGGPAALGAGLARLHAAGAPAHGAAGEVAGGRVVGTSSWLGSVPVDDTPAPSWAEFLAERRWRPLAEAAVRAGAASKDLVGTVEKVSDRLGDLVPEEPPARLHGDLWSGNVVWGGDGAAWLIDPAAHGGHRETDLAMLDLFGGLSAVVADAYQASAADAGWPLVDGWRDRLDLHQVTPLLVHAVLFGRGWASRAEAVLDRYR